jgi:hypothetical protein
MTCATCARDVEVKCQTGHHFQGYLRLPPSSTHDEVRGGTTETRPVIEGLTEHDTATDELDANVDVQGPCYGGGSSVLSDLQGGMAD